MNNSTLHIENPSQQLLDFLREQREKKEKEEQELLRLSHLYFPEKECTLCKNQPKT